MNQLLEALREASMRAWVHFVQGLNLLAVAIGGIVIAVNSMYPTAVQDVAAALPPAVRLALLAGWAGLVHYSLRRAKKAVE